MRIKTDHSILFPMPPEPKRDESERFQVWKKGPGKAPELHMEVATLVAAESIAGSIRRRLDRDGPGAWWCVGECGTEFYPSDYEAMERLRHVNPGVDLEEVQCVSR